MRDAVLPIAAAMTLALFLATTAGAAPSTHWAAFPPGAFPVGTTTTVSLSSGSQVDVTVQTGGTQGVNGGDLDTLGAMASGLNYEHLYELGIFNGGGSASVSTSLTFSNVTVGPAHKRGLLLVGAVNGQSSPVTVTSTVAGRAATWTVVGNPFDLGPTNSFPITWNAGTGTLTTTALSGNDSQCIVLDLGDLRTDGTIAVSLQQNLNDGIVYAFGEELLGALDVPVAKAGGRAGMAPPRPNPARESVALEFSLPASGRARLAAYDLAGRRLATLAEGDFAAGAHARAWDLRDAAGARLPAGLVFVRLETPGGTLTRRLLIAR